MSHIIRINDDQLDEIVRSELEYQLNCCDESEVELVEAFTKVIEVFTPASEIINREMEQARSPVVDNAVNCDEGYPRSTYMYGRLDQLNEPSDVRVSYHFGV